MGDGRAAKTVLCVAKIVCVSVPQKWRSGSDKKVFCSTDPPCPAGDKLDKRERVEAPLPWPALP